MNRSQVVPTALLVTAALAVPLMATAQDEAGGALEEITVTARKREENLMEVPISISVVSGEVLQSGNIGKLESLAPTIPNFHHSEAVSGNDQIFVRGVGSGVNSGFENSVGQVFDGFFFGRSRFGRSLFLDLERVEILKGPQGALIGKNTSAGAINIASAKPTEGFEAYFVPTYEFDGDEGITVEGAASGPLSERAGGRVAFRYEDHDGYVKNLTRDTKEMARQTWTVRGIVDLQISEDLDATLMYQYMDQTREGRPVEVARCGAALTATLASLGDDCQFNRTNSRILLHDGEEVPSATDTEAHLAGLTLNWETRLGTVTSLTGYSRYETNDEWDADHVVAEGIAIRLAETYEQWSEEIRLASRGEHALDYVIGAYFLNTDQQTKFRLNFNFKGPDPLPNLPAFARAASNRETDQQGDTQAVFGQLTWHVHPQWDLTAGFRYTHETKDARHVMFTTALYTDTPVAAPPFGPAANTHDVTGSRTENQFTPNGIIQWRPNGDTMLYGSISKGFKGGGFDHFLGVAQADAEQQFEYDDESVVAYEVGGKFTFPEARVQVDVAAFRSEFDNLQVSTLLPGAGTTFRVGNAASAISQGLEAGVRWRPLQNFRLNASAAYLNAEFDKYLDAPCYAAQSVAEGCVGGNQDLSGKELQFAPDWSYSIDGTYTWQLSGNLRLSLFGRIYYSDAYAMALDLDPDTFQDAFTKIDATLTLLGGGGKWRVSLIGRNLTDEKTANFANDGPSDESTFFFSAPPRSLALQARINF